MFEVKIGMLAEFQTPCENCLCIPICRHKEYYSLLQCKLLYNFLYVNFQSALLDIRFRRSDYAVRIKEIYKLLNTDKWYIDKIPYTIPEDMIVDPDGVILRG